MRYGEVIVRSLQIAWRHRYLWLLAILGGADTSSTSNLNSRFNFSQPGRFPSGGTLTPEPGEWLAANLGLILTIGIVVLLLAVAWFFLSCITTPALVRAAAEHDAERDFGFGLAWRAGWQRFGAMLRLRLIMLGVMLPIILVFATLAVLGIQAYRSGDMGALAGIIVLGGVVGLGLAVVLIPVGILFILATRSLTLELTGALAALGRGYQLFRDRLGRTLLVWLIQVGLAIGAGLALVVVFAILAVIALVAFIPALMGHDATVALVVGIPIGLTLFALAVLLSGMLGAYFSTYWTLAFRRLELESPAPSYYPQPPYYPPPGSYYQP